MEKTGSYSGSRSTVSGRDLARLRAAILICYMCTFERQTKQNVRYNANYSSTRIIIHLKLYCKMVTGENTQIVPLEVRNTEIHCYNAVELGVDCDCHSDLSL